jgi:hypothetical protein
MYSSCRVTTSVAAAKGLGTHQLDKALYHQRIVWPVQAMRITFL